ncbi:MAG: prolipoprotein diacylglyceryl transferase [Chloroflexota bacterium]
MNGIVISIDPVLFRAGALELRWYGIAITAAIVIAVVVAFREAKRVGFPTAEVIGVTPWVLLGGIVGARLFHVIDRWQYYAANPLGIVMLQQGGLAIWGAVVGGGVALLVYCLKRRLPVLLFADVLVPALLAAQIVGRFGCIVNGDAWGGPTSLPWGFIYVHPDALVPAALVGVPTHPYPVYEMLWNGAVLGVLLAVRGRIGKPGLLFVIYLALYAIGRFGFTFVRQETGFWLGLQQAQLVALGILAVSIVAALVIILRKPGTLQWQSTL